MLESAFHIIWCHSQIALFWYRRVIPLNISRFMLESAFHIIRIWCDSQIALFGMGE